jgi:hypothetical protein
MGKLASWLRFGGTVVASLVVGFVIGFGLHGVLPMDHHSVSIEPLPPKLDTLLQEAAVFFYDTMREVFQRTDGLQEDRVSQRALVVFNEYRSRLEPKCWLVNIHPSYGFVSGEALFPSGDVFEVGIVKKPDKGWTLDWLNHMGTRYFYHNLTENQPAKAN